MENGIELSSASANRQANSNTAEDALIETIKENEIFKIYTNERDNDLSRRLEAEKRGMNAAKGGLKKAAERRYTTAKERLDTWRQMPEPEKKQEMEENKYTQAYLDANSKATKLAQAIKQEVVTQKELARKYPEHTPKTVKEIVQYIRNPQQGGRRKRRTLRKHKRRTHKRTLRKHKRRTHRR